MTPEARMVVAKFKLTKRLDNTDTLEVVFVNNLFMGGRWREDARNSLIVA
jgi:hypothetical protein